MKDEVNKSNKRRAQVSGRRVKMKIEGFSSFLFARLLALKGWILIAFSTFRQRPPPLQFQGHPYHLQQPSNGLQMTFGWRTILSFILLQRCCSAVAALLPLCCSFITDLLQLSCSFVAALLLLCCCFVAALLPLCCSFVAALLLPLPDHKFVDILKSLELPSGKAGCSDVTQMHSVLWIHGNNL